MRESRQPFEKLSFKRRLAKRVPPRITVGLAYRLDTQEDRASGRQIVGAIARHDGAPNRFNQSACLHDPQRLVIDRHRAGLFDRAWLSIDDESRDAFESQ